MAELKELSPDLVRAGADLRVTVGRIARRERIRPQAMGVTLSELEGRGLVHREADSVDGRKVLMSVTPAGRKMLSERRSASAERITRALSEEFTALERRKLLAVLPLLDRLAERL